MIDILAIIDSGAPKQTPCYRFDFAIAEVEIQRSSTFQCQVDHRVVIEAESVFARCSPYEANHGANHIEANTREIQRPLPLFAFALHANTPKPMGKKWHRSALPLGERPSPRTTHLPATPTYRRWPPPSQPESAFSKNVPL